ncbi:MAG: ABC transporter permease [Candidatus Accumulibacter sp.]|uniref:Transport permease protein n=1 Tax=Candidatus Accumulibacter proximus TaxID=2954385 RepID=A0A935PX47_9PROT|nr:ABC transporter permease [Candidatus Accumulibacter proximus]
MARRELSDRYAGQAFGLLWAIGHPVFLIGLYVFVFAFVFKQKIGGTVDMPLDYTTYLLAGLVAWLSFQESMVKSCTAITGNSALVKQVVFPLEVLPVKGVLSSLFPQLVSLLLLVGYVLLTHGSLHATYLLLPVLLAMQVMAMIGIAYILAPVGAYFRDIKDFVQLFATAGVFLMPVFYLPAWVPDVFKPLLYLNPFSYLAWCYQDALYFGRFEHPWAWVFTGVVSPATFVIGYRVFRKLKPGLGNLL